MAESFKKEYDGSMDSKYYFTAGKIGATASPQSPNQIGELTSRLNQGLKAVEIGTMNQRLMDQIPKEHFKEMRRLGELTGSEATMHAPIQDLDLAGFTQQGWDKSEQKGNVAKLKSVIDRAHLLNSKGNMPITVHAGSFPAQKWRKGELYKGGPIEEGQKPLEDARSEMVVVNQDTGQMQGLQYKEKQYIDGRKVSWSPEYAMNNMNATSWEGEKLKLMQFKKELNEVQDRFAPHAPRYHELKEADKKDILTPQEKEELKELDQQYQDVASYGQEIHQNVHSLAEDMYHRYREFKPKIKESKKTREEKQREERFKDNMKIISEKQDTITSLHEQREKLDKKLKQTTSDKEKEKIGGKYDRATEQLIKNSQEQSEIIVRNFDNMEAPNTWVSADEFAKDKVSESITEAALYAYGKYGENAPIISMENVYPEFTLSRAESLKETIETAKSNFAERLVKDKKLSKKKADEVADKTIGVTWDVGHIYMLKKHGYTDEDIKKEVAKIAKHVKHVHLTDNFGFEDSHLPPGEGAVNIKDQLEEIEKAGYEGKSIVEAGEFVANFKEVPHLYALSNLNSPLYAEETGPYWKDIWDSQGNYMSGFGEMMPQKYFDLYGAPGFSQLPTALGGAGGSGPDRGRFASSPDEES